MYPKVTARQAKMARTSSWWQSGGVAEPFASAFILYRRWGHWRAKKRAEKALFEMPDHLLKDIGISRGQIMGAIMRPEGTVSSCPLPAELKQVENQTDDVEQGLRNDLASAKIRDVH
jgi:uncharacterized protein YjiS (DUF1127 family)